MSRSLLNFSLYAKYPNIGLGKNMNLYPILSLDYELAISGKLEYADGRKYVFDDRNEDGKNAGALGALWVKIGGGIDYYVTTIAYIRAELLYGMRMTNDYEQWCVDELGAEKTRLGHGLTIKAGAGFKL
jgi:hypothetical protein